MSFSQVVLEKDLINHLIKSGYEPTKEKTNTGTIWKSIVSGKYLQIPFPYEGAYPDWMLNDLEIIIGKVVPTIQ